MKPEPQDLEPVAARGGLRSWPIFFRVCFFVTLLVAVAAVLSMVVLAFG